MKLAGDHKFEGAGVQDVWDALFDPEVLAAAMPGCEKLELVDGKLVGEMVIKVGPISGKFTGTVAFADKQEPASYRMNVDGKGGPGFVKATATISLAADGDGTRLSYDADAQIGGKLATVGARLVDASAKAITKQSLDNLGTNIAIRIANRGAASKPAPVDDKPDAKAGEQAQADDRPDAKSDEPAKPDEQPDELAAKSGTPAQPVEAKPAASAEPAVVAASAVIAAVAEAPARRGDNLDLKPDRDPTPPTPARPQQAYVKADAKAMAKTAMKASLGAMLPYLLVVAAVIALVVWLLVR